MKMAPGNRTDLSYALPLRLNIVSCCLVASAFGPYLLPEAGLRLDHVVIYGFFLILFSAAAVPGSSIRAPGALIAIMALLAAIVLWTTVVTVFGGHAKLSWNSIMASSDNFLQPMAVVGVMALVTAGVPKLELSRSLKNVSISICLLLSVNSILAACQLVWDTWPVARYFLRSLEEQTVWEHAVVQGRYSGIFDQPFENGLAYSIGLMSWIYFSNNSSSKWQWLLLPLLVIGGVLSASKVFLLGGAPAATLYFVFSRDSRPALYIQVALGLIGAAVAVESILGEWIGISFFSILVDPSFTHRDLLGLYTAGRFGREGWILTQFAYVWNLDVLCGFGFGTAVVFDNAYLEFFWQAGVMGLIIYLAIIGTILWAGILGVSRNEPIGFMIVLFCAMIVGIGFGGPVLTVNRSSILLWVVISIGIAMVSCSEMERRVPTRRSPSLPFAGTNHLHQKDARGQSC